MSSKYQREIEEILKNSGPISSFDQSSRRSERHGLIQLIALYTKHAIGGKLLSASSGRVMVAGLLIMLTLLIMMQFVTGVPGLLAWAGLLIFIVGYGMALVKPPKIEKRWRGRSIENNDNSAWDRIKRNLGRRGRST